MLSMIQSTMLNLTTHQPAANFKVKEERHDEAEIRELAAKMKEQHKVDSAKAAAQQRQQQQQLAARSQAGTNAAATGTNNMLNYVTRKPNAIALSGGTTAGTVNGQSDGKSKSGENGDAAEKKACDDESQRGHFGWATFGKIHIPYILRQAEKYCAVRMVEMKLLTKYLSYLHADIYSCTCVRSYYITEAECRLLNEINHKHCDSQFGREMFTLKDLVVRLSDANKFYQFLDVCYKKLLMGSSGPSDKCGFIRINKESVVPYTVRDGQKFVPLFYFEGETENLKLKADSLSGWDLSYLKFCCKVQGIRNELFASDSVAVISLTDIKSYFPNGTEFEDYWPSKVVDSQLLIGTSTPKSGNNSVAWTRQPAAPPPKTNMMATNAGKAASAVQARKPNVYSAHMPNVATTQQRMQTATNLANNHSNIAAAAAQALGWPPLASAQAMLTQAQTEQLLRMTQQAQQLPPRTNYNQRSHLQNQMASRQQTYPGYSNNALNTGTSQQVQQPPPLVRSGTQQAHLSAVAAATALRQQQLQQYQQQQQQIQQQQQQQQQRHSSSSSSMHQRFSQQHDMAGSIMIPDVPMSSGYAQPPYKIQKIPVTDRSVPCINMKGYAYNSDFLMTLSDFNEYFFPNVSLENCKRVLSVLKIDQFAGNRQQCLAFMEAGKSNVDSMPLVQIRDIVQYMAQLNYMLRASLQEQPSSKRARIS